MDLIAERKSLYSSFEKLSIATKNGENIVFAIIDIEEAEKIIKSLQGFFEEFTLDFNNMRKIQNRICNTQKYKIGGAKIWVYSDCLEEKKKLN